MFSTKKMTMHLCHLKQSWPKDGFSPSMKKQVISEDWGSFGFATHFLHFVHEHELEKQDENEFFIGHSN